MEEPLQAGLAFLFNNFWLLGMMGAYTLLLFYPHAIGNIHARVIISLFVVFILPGFLLYKLFFSRHDHDIYERITLFFLLSCFTFLITGSIAYYFSLPLLFYMKSLLFLFIICGSVLLYRNPNIQPVVSKITKSAIIDFTVLLITGILAYFLTAKGTDIVADGLAHLTSIVKTAQTGIITDHALGYLYSPFYLMVSVAIQLSAAGQYFAWNHLPKVIIFLLPICYYSLIKTAFNDKRIAYYAFAFIVGLNFADYYWYTISYPYPRRFNRELLIPVFYILFIRYFKSSEKKDLILLIISSMVLVMFHTSSVPFVLFNSLLFLLSLFIFKDGVRNFKDRLFAFIAIFLANFPYLIGVMLTMPLKSYIKDVHIFTYDVAVKVFYDLFMFKPEQFFTTDHLFAYSVLICLILIQSNSVVTLIMFSALAAVPVFLLFPPFATFFSKFFTSIIMARLQDISIRPFFAISFLFLLSFYGFKYVKRLSEHLKSSLLYRMGVVLLIAVNTYFITGYFWVRQRRISVDILCSELLYSFKVKSILVTLVVISVILFYYLNRKKSLDVLKPISFDCGREPHFLAVMFIPLALATIYLFPGFIKNVSLTQKIGHPNTGGYSLDDNYIPQLFQYISTHEKPLSVTVLARDRQESFEVRQFIPQFALFGKGHPHFAGNIKFSKEVIDRIYDENVSIDITLDLIDKYKVNYIIAHGDQHKKFTGWKTYFKLVSRDKNIYLYRAGN